jgi:hypothetical protein
MISIAPEPEAMKRKRDNPGAVPADPAPPAKKPKTRPAATPAHGQRQPPPPAAPRAPAVLTCYYPRVLTLRAYLAARLLEDTKGKAGNASNGDRLLESRLAAHAGPRADAARALLDGVVVAHGDGGGRAADERVRARDLLLFSQLEPSSTLGRAACRTLDWAVLQREVRLITTLCCPRLTWSRSSASPCGCCSSARGARSRPRTCCARGSSGARRRG